MNGTNPLMPLRDTLYAFSIAKPVPDAELLDEFSRRYPEHAAALTDFAIDIILDAARQDDDDIVPTTATVSPTVSRVMSRFQNRLHDERTTGIAHAQRTAGTSSTVENPFTSLDRTAFRSLAHRLNINTVFLTRLRDRQVDVHTIPPAFTRRVAEELRAPIELVVAHLQSQPALSHGQYYKADKKPQVGPKQTFEQAVRNSGLTTEQQEFLLSL